MGSGPGAARGAPGSPRPGTQCIRARGPRSEGALAPGPLPFPPRTPPQGPRWTPRDRKCPPVGTGGAEPGGGTSGAHAPPPRSSGAVTLCSAGRAGPGPTPVSGGGSAAGARGEWAARRVGGEAGGRRALAAGAGGPGAGVGSGSRRPSTPAREAAGRQRRAAGRAGPGRAWVWGGPSGALAWPSAAAPTLGEARGPPPGPARRRRAPTPRAGPGGQRGVGGLGGHTPATPGRCPPPSRLEGRGLGRGRPRGHTHPGGTVTALPWLLREAEADKPPGGMEMAWRPRELA